MKNIFRNNIITNPIGWAIKIVGTNFRYRYIQVVTVIFPILVLFVAFIVPRHSFWEYGLTVGIVFFFIATALPLMYLRALRHLYLDMNEKCDPKNQ